jgi:small subunit ribosomal protein S6
LNEYEILLMLDPELAEERSEEIIARIRTSVEGDGGKWDGHEPWGRRKLAYEIDHKPDGFYHLLLFSSTPEVLDEMTRILRITDGVLRHMAVRRPKSSAPAQQAQPQPEAAPEERESTATEPEAASEEQAGASAEPAATPEEPDGAASEPEPEPEVVQEAG